MIKIANHIIIFKIYLKIFKIYIWKFMKIKIYKLKIKNKIYLKKLI